MCSISKFSYLIPGLEIFSLVERRSVFCWDVWSCRSRRCSWGSCRSRRSITRRIKPRWRSNCRMVAWQFGKPVNYKHLYHTLRQSFLFQVVPQFVKKILSHFLLLSAFLRNFFLRQDRLSGDVPPPTPHLAQPFYVALGRALIWGF